MKKNDFGFIYHKDYNKYDLGVNHPLIGDKPKKALDFFKEKGIMRDIKEFTPQMADEKDLLRVHTKDYVETVKELSITGGMLAIDTPAPIGIFECASLAAGGTILGGNKLFEGFNCMINPLAGFHHAGRSSSSGFCFFNDIAIVIEYLREKYNLKRFEIVDLDVHHHNGTQEIFFKDPSVLKISFHQDGRTLYPGTGAIEKIGREEGEGFSVNLPLPPLTGNKSYLKAFNEIVPCLTKQFEPDIIIYQSGVDTHYSDPLADLCLTYPIYYEIAKNMIKLSNETCKKLLVLFGGGYNSNASVLSYYNIMCGLLGKKEYITEKEVFDKKLQEVDELVKQLKQILSPYWRL